MGSGGIDQRIVYLREEGLAFVDVSKEDKCSPPPFRISHDMLFAVRLVGGLLVSEVYHELLGYL